MQCRQSRFSLASFKVEWTCIKVELMPMWANRKDVAEYGNIRYQLPLPFEKKNPSNRKTSDNWQAKLACVRNKIEMLVQQNTEINVNTHHVHRQNHRSWSIQVLHWATELLGPETGFFLTPRSSRTDSSRQPPQTCKVSSNEIASQELSLFPQ